MLQHSKSLTFDQTRFIVALGALASTFGREVDEALIMGFEMGLEGLTTEQIERSVALAVRTKKFFPSPAELRELAGEVPSGERAVVAWDAFAQAVSKHGYYDSVDFDDPVINATIRNLGGWQRVCQIDDPKEFETFFRKDFERVYVALYKAGISPEQASPLIGYCESQNALNGYCEKQHNGVAINQVRRIATGLPAPLTRISVPQDRPRRITEGPKSIGEILSARIE